LKAAILAVEELSRGALAKLYSVPVIVRAIHSLARGGVEEVTIICSDVDEVEDAVFRWDIPIRMNLVGAVRLSEGLSRLKGLFKERFILSLGCYVFEESAVRLLAGRNGPTVLVDSKPPVEPRFRLPSGEGGFSGLALVDEATVAALEGSSSVDELVERLYEGGVEVVDLESSSVYDAELKRSSKPLCMDLADRTSLERCKGILLGRIGKGKHFTSKMNHPVENAITKLIADTPITPNHVTILTNVLAYICSALFLTGHFRMGSILAYLTGVLDGVDGKLARVRGILTKLGHMEHSFDMLFEQVWYAAFGLSLIAHGYGGWRELVLLMAFLVSDSFTRHVYMQFRAVTGIALTDYSRFDRVFARIDGRRNMYVLYMIGLSLLNHPQLALPFMLSHSLATTAVYAVRACIHLRRLDRSPFR